MIKITAMEEYGVRCLVRLARNGAGQPVTCSSLAEAEHVPPLFAEQILRRFRFGGLVTSVRGPHGGYVLAKDPVTITLGEVVRLLDAGLGEDICNQFNKDGRSCGHLGGCSLRPIWQWISQRVTSALDQTSLAQLLAEETQVAYEIAHQEEFVTPPPSRRPLTFSIRPVR